MTDNTRGDDHHGHRALVVIVCGAGLIALTFLAFSPVLDAEFVNWDDESNIVRNPAFRGFGSENLRWMFTTFHAGHYQPLTWLTLALDHRFWMLDARGYHLTNLLLHAAGTLAFFFVARRLLRVSTGLTLGAYVTVSAAVAAALFAVHPLRVESVAWVTERRDVLSGLFFFCAVLAYLRYAEARLRQPAARGVPVVILYAAALALHAMSLLSKAAALGLPVVLLVLDAYPLRRLGGDVGWFTRRARGVWLEKVPFALLAIGFGWVALAAQADVGALYPLEEYSLGSRIGQAVYGLVFYLVKTLHPVNLGPIYEIPDQPLLLDRGFGIRLLLVVVMTIALVGLRRRWPAGLAVWVCYIVILLPVLGLVQAGRQLVADRYTYLSCTGLALLGGAALLWSFRSRIRQNITAATAHAVSGTAVLIIAALALLTYSQSGFWEHSVSLWNQGVKVSPNSAIAQVNLANALMESGFSVHAIPYYRRGVTIDPTDAKGHRGYAIALMRIGDLDGALAQLRNAISVNPEYALAHATAGDLLAGGFGRFDEAAQAYSRSLQLDPDLANARLGLAACLKKLGRYQQARDVLIDSIGRQPNDTRFAAELAWLLATCPDDTMRDGAKAVTLAEDVCRQEGSRNPYSLRTLAAALAEAGRFEHAVTTARQAEDIAHRKGLDDLVESLNAHLELYQARRPYRKPDTQPATTQPVDPATP